MGIQVFVDLLLEKGVDFISEEVRDEKEYQ
jgi:hypothetical protein